MLSLFQAIMPKEMRFFDLFNRHAKTLVDGAEALGEVLQGGASVVPGCAKVIAAEEEADEIAAEVMLSVRRTFITPFDRGDIKDLISSLDDAIDQMRKTAKVISLFEVTSFDPATQELGRIILAAAKLTAESVSLLGAMRANVGRLNELHAKITLLEGESDAIYDAGRKALFQMHGKGGKGGDPMAFIVGVDIYSHLEKVVDRLEDVANRISGIVIEQV
jgi:predicted phosphate transport protein (TIGR00153 family)